MQHLCQQFYNVILPLYFQTAKKRSQIKQEFESIATNKSIYQFFGGFLLTIDGRKEVQEIYKQGWEVLRPDPRTSDAIEQQLFFGRTVLVPGNRVFVISGSLSKTTTVVVSP